ncbi:hypothetical protein ACHHYP_14472 [Achlya hypogyna]|uniref:Uncharacterized protein n=1 Tax=Achlya hypogyna TaxID=1202772 RepID=A0A1V9YCZ5_ACHHY|nr:hypothetical protein ACHHYP_14472 [Achlya hypogyna]
MLPAIHRGRPLEKPKTPQLAPSNQERPLADEFLERISALERDNDRLRHDVQQLKAAQHDDARVQQLHELQTALAAKVQSDAFRDEKDKQKAAAIFGEARMPPARSIVRLGKAFEDQRQLSTACDQRLSALEKRALEPVTSFASETKLREHDHALEELRALMLATRGTVTQLKTEAETERWKVMEMGSSASRSDDLEGRLIAQVDRLAHRVAADKADMQRALEEQRDMQAAIEARRASQMVHDTKRLSDHVGGLEQLLLHETKAMTQHVQAIVTESDAKFRAVVDELGHEVRHRNSAYVQLDEDLRAQVTDLAEATREVTASLQMRLRDVEEVLPLEIKARQKGDEKLKRRLETLVKGVTTSVEGLRADVNAGVNQAVLRTNACVAHQIELQAAVARQSDDARAAVQAMQRDFHGAIGNALEATAKEHAQRLVACLDVVDTVKQLQASTDDRFERVRASQAELEAKTASLLHTHDEGHGKAVEELHARMLQLRGALDDLKIMTLAQLSSGKADVQSRLSAVVKETRAIAAQVDALHVGACVDHLVAQVTGQGAAQETHAEMQTRFRSVEERQRDLVQALVRDQRSMDARWVEATGRLHAAQSADAAKLANVQDTLVTMSWNIEDRRVDEIVTAVLHECVLEVEGRSTADALDQQQQAMRATTRDLQLQIQVQRNKMEEIRGQLRDALKDDYMNLRASIAVINQTLDSLRARAGSVETTTGYLI